jgi:hypothetical protein
MSDIDKLLPCPFCGGQFAERSYDRMIKYICEPCGYSRAFDGLLSTVKNDKPILQYNDGNGGIKEIKPEDAKEYYHHDAHEKAIEQMNMRA